MSSVVKRSSGKFLGFVVAAVALAGAARADDGAPPWTDLDEVPLADDVRSVVPRKGDTALYSVPGKLDSRRGSVLASTRLPFFGSKRGAGCSGHWYLVGPLAWICSDVAELSDEEPFRPVPPRSPTGLPFRYFFAGRDGAYGYSSIARAEDEAPDMELEHGFGVAVVGERTAPNGERFGLSRSGYFIPLKDLVQARSSGFHGERIVDRAAGAPLDLAWVVVEKANVFAAPKAGQKPNGQKVRFELLHVAKVEGAFARVSPEGAPEAWMRLVDLARPQVTTPPTEVGGESAVERWIDVEIASQTLVAYQGKEPVFATIVSTGKGAPHTELATRTGVHRIWVKLLASKMDNLERDDVEHHYSLEDVPWVQFFDKAIALHGVFWHHDFGHVHSHGCVNLAPLDAEYLFSFTGPHMPAGWSAVFPTKVEPATVIRVR